MLNWIVMDIIGRKQRKLKSVRIRKNKKPTVKRNTSKIKNKNRFENKKEQLPKQKVNNLNEITPERNNKRKHSVPSSEQKSSRKANVKEKENTIIDNEDKMMYSSSAPASNKSASIGRDTKARPRRATQTKVDYRRANDRGLESHASFRI